MRGRNADWAERAVREAVSLSAAEALKLKVIDVVAVSVPELLQQIDGRKVRTPAGERTLATAGAATIEMEPDWRARLLMIIASPSIAMVLMMIGIYGLIYEIDESMVRAIAQQAEAERARRAKIIHAEGEQQAAEKLLEAARMLAQQPEAIQLRYLQTLGAIAGDKNSTIVFPVPLDLLRTLRQSA